jgi:hypothetical protein
MHCSFPTLCEFTGNLAELSKRANASELMRQKQYAQIRALLNSGIAKSTVSKETGRRITAFYSNWHLQRGGDPLRHSTLYALMMNLPPQLRKL